MSKEDAEKVLNEIVDVFTSKEVMSLIGIYPAMTIYAKIIKIIYDNAHLED